MVQELQSYAVSEGEGKYETAVSHGYIGYGINVALAHEGYLCSNFTTVYHMLLLTFSNHNEVVLIHHEISLFTIKNIP